MMNIEKNTVVVALKQTYFSTNLGYTAIGFALLHGFVLIYVPRSTNSHVLFWHDLIALQNIGALLYLIYVACNNYLLFPVVDGGTNIWMSQGLALLKIFYVAALVPLIEAFDSDSKKRKRPTSEVSPCFWFLCDSWLMFFT